MLPTCHEATTKLTYLKTLKQQFEEAYSVALASNTPQDWSLAKTIKQTLDLKMQDLALSIGIDLNFNINEQEAQNLNLTRLELQSYPTAQSLIDQITSQKLDITTPKGRKTFVEQWTKENPSLPLPCVPDKSGNYINGDYWFLERLYGQRIIKNIEGTTIPTTTHYETPQVLYIDSWQEEDYDNKTKSLTENISPILKKLLNKEGVTNISRNQIDQALFEGDPSNNIKTPTHIALIKKLNLDPEEYTFRLISYDEYARGAETQNWGQKILWTHFNEYRLHEDEDRGGLYGGNRVNGGASDVAARHRDYAGVYGAVRLVLARIPLN